MTSRRGGSEGYKSPPSPPSSGSEDNGFTNRPRVAGLYVKNLSREELDELAKEGSSRDFDGQDYLRGAISRTPQPFRRSGVGARHREFSENLVRRDHHGSLPMEKSWRPRRLEDRPGQASPERGSSIDVRITGEESRPRRFAEGSRYPEGLSPGVSSSRELDRDQVRSSRSVERSPPSYAGLSPPEYTEYEEPQAAKIRPKTTIRAYQNGDEEREPCKQPSSPLTEEKDQEDVVIFKTMNVGGGAEEIPSSSRTSSVTEKPISPESKKSESPPAKRVGSRVQDSTRLRPPLAGTAGTSADSGTGDSGSAEIQADVVTPQAASGDVLDSGVSKIEGKSPGARTPGTKGGKQTVKPFTKESLDRLENKTVQLVREYGFQPKRKMSVEDGAVLPNKFEPFPRELYGRPLEEIDNFIYDECHMKLFER
ncbi:sodium channel protein 60e [Lasius niger]|uniref:Sodium channel protein 60e n=1 Tax=Lasius niger TaxID=67767 RepID=A0A0J7L245_LASNI|nr:sodium channel protein 60e [Lasius niger]